MRTALPAFALALSACSTMAAPGPAPAPPSADLVSNWSIAAIDGEAIPPSDAYHLQFGTDGRVSGQAGCNRFSGPYTEVDDAITMGPFAVTRMACPEPRMTHERKVLEFLSGLVRSSRPDARTMTLTRDGHSLRLDRQ
jgi:heat shock protein HslJ